VVVVNRTPRRAEEAAGLAGPAGSVVDPSDVEGALTRAVAAADLVVNATPVGMTGVSGPATSDAEWVVKPQLLQAGQVAADLVYSPRPTRWLAAAGRAGARTLDGLGMLVHQAAAQVTLWTGLDAPLGAMWEAGEAALPASD
jgi:shikimate dehydrogenase